MIRLYVDASSDVNDTFRRTPNRKYLVSPYVQSRSLYDRIDYISSSTQAEKESLELQIDALNAKRERQVVDISEWTTKVDSLQQHITEVTVQTEEQVSTMITGFYSSRLKSITCR